MSLALPWKEGAQMADGLIGDLRPVNQIYEYWCFFSLYEILRSLCSEIGGGNFVTIAQDGLSVRLAKGRRSECHFEYVSAAGEKVSVSLFFNRRFRRPNSARATWSGSYTAAFDPDFSIVVVSGSDSQSAHWLHFDAKYRLDRIELEKEFGERENVGEESDEAAVVSYESELARVHKQEDLFKMHTYRDGILSTRGAYVIYPGDGAGGRLQEPGKNLFVRHPMAFGGVSEYRIPSVGAFALTPNGGPGQLSAIRDLLFVVFESACSGRTYVEEQAFF